MLLLHPLERWIDDADCQFLMGVSLYYVFTTLKYGIKQRKKHTSGNANEAGTYSQPWFMKLLRTLETYRRRANVVVVNRPCRTR